MLLYNNEQFFFLLKCPQPLPCNQLQNIPEYQFEIYPTPTSKKPTLTEKMLLKLYKYVSLYFIKCTIVSNISEPLLQMGSIAMIYE